MADNNHDQDKEESTSASSAITRQNKGTLIGISVAIGLALLVVGIGAGFLVGLTTTHFGARTRLGVQGPSAGGAGMLGGRGAYGANGTGIRRTLSGTRGTVTAVSDTSLSLKTASGSVVTYTITSDTKVTNGGNTAAVSDIKVGDTVRVVQANDSTGNAASVAIE